MFTSPQGHGTHAWKHKYTYTHTTNARTHIRAKLVGEHFGVAMPEVEDEGGKGPGRFMGYLGKRKGGKEKGNRSGSVSTSTGSRSSSSSSTSPECEGSKLSALIEPQGALSVSNGSEGGQGQGGAEELEVRFQAFVGMLHKKASAQSPPQALVPEAPHAAAAAAAAATGGAGGASAAAEGVGLLSQAAKSSKSSSVAPPVQPAYGCIGPSASLGLVGRQGSGGSEGGGGGSMVAGSEGSCAALLPQEAGRGELSAGLEGQRITRTPQEVRQWLH